MGRERRFSRGFSLFLYLFERLIRIWNTRSVIRSESLGEKMSCAKSDLGERSLGLKSKICASIFFFKRGQMTRKSIPLEKKRKKVEALAPILG